MDDVSDVSVTAWLRALNEGDPEAAGQIWQRYFDRLVAVARNRSAGKKRVTDEEDVALSVLDTLFRGAREGRFGDIGDRQELWRLLVTIAGQKAIDHARHEGRQKRGGGQVRGHSVFGKSGDDGLQDFAELASGEPTPEMLVMLDDEHARLVELLRDDVLRRIAQLRMAGYGNAEIAQQVEMSERSVERKLNLIRATWARELEE